MGLGGGLSFFKYMMFAFNFLFWLAGVYLLIVAAALMMVVGFLGCCGAIKESPLMLGLFFMFLFLIFIGEVAAGIWALSNKDTIVEEVKNFYTETYNNYLATKQETLKEALRVFQFSLQCCGTGGINFDGARDTCPKKQDTEQFVTTSCPAAIDDLFNSKLHIIGGVGIGIGVIMIFGMICSMMLLCAIKRTRDVV